MMDAKTRERLIAKRRLLEEAASDLKLSIARARARCVDSPADGATLGYFRGQRDAYIHAAGLIADILLEDAYSDLADALEARS